MRNRFKFWDRYHNNVKLFFIIFVQRKKNIASHKSFSEVEELEDDLDPDERDDEPLQPDVMLVAQMRPNLQKQHMTKLGPCLVRIELEQAWFFGIRAVSGFILRACVV